MRTDEYAAQDACGLRQLVAAGEVTPAEVAAAATDANHRLQARGLGAVIEWYDDPDRPEIGQDGGVSGVRSKTGRWAGVPVLRKDYGATEAGRLVERGSRLSVGWRATTTSALFRHLSELGVVVRGW